MSGLAITFSVIALIIGTIFAIGIYQSQTGTEKIIEATAGDCSIAPTIDVRAANKVKPGTSVTAVPNAIVNGDYYGPFSSSTTFADGDEVEIMLNTSNYIGTILPTTKLKCGANTVTAKVYATDAFTLTLFNTDNNKLTDDVALVDASGTNQSTSSTTINIDVEITATADDSTGDLVCVVDANNSAYVGDLAWEGSSGAANIPSFYQVLSTKSKVEAFEIPAITSGVNSPQAYTIMLEPVSGQTIQEIGVNVSCYSKQYHVETVGNFAYGVENNDNTAKWEDITAHAFWIGN